MKIYDLPEGTGIIFTPSETSAQLIPILFAKGISKLWQGKPASYKHILTSMGAVSRECLWAAGGLDIFKNVKVRHFEHRQDDFDYNMKLYEELKQCYE